ncbi:MAG: RICIN domain-containing protein [Mycobacterium sp.]
MKRRALVAIALLAMAALNLPAAAQQDNSDHQRTGAPLDQQPQSDRRTNPALRQPPSAAERSKAAQQRAEFGLDKSDIAIGAAFAGEADWTYGTPLTGPEAAEMRRRSRVADALAVPGGLDEFVKANDSLGGAYIDHPNGGALVIQVLARTPATVLSAVASKVPTEAGTVQYKTVEFSAADLATAKKLLDNQFLSTDKVAPTNLRNALRAGGIALVALFTDSRANRIVVGFERLTPTLRSTAERIWDGLAATGAAPNRAMVNFVASGRSTRQDDHNYSTGTMKAGLRLTGPANVPCTSGLAAIGKTDGVRYLLTAGHCWGGTPEVKDGSGTRIGFRQGGVYNNDMYADVSYIRLDQPGKASPNALAIKCPGCLPNIDTITQARNPTVNDIACMNGIATIEVTCRQVLSTSFSGENDDGTTYQDFAVSLYTSDLGDSGALVGNGPTAFGLHSGEFEEQGWRIFSKIARVLGEGQGYQLDALVSPNGWDWPANSLTLASDHSGFCMDDFNAQLGNGTQIQSWGCHGGNAQRWTMIPSRNTGDPFGNGSTPSYEIKLTIGNRSKCLDVPNGLNGTALQLYDCHGGLNQKFWLYHNGGGRFQLQALHSYGCVEVEWNGWESTRYDQGKRVIQVDCNPSHQNQVWRIER